MTSKLTVSSASFTAANCLEEKITISGRKASKK